MATEPRPLLQKAFVLMSQSTALSRRWPHVLPWFLSSSFCTSKKADHSVLVSGNIPVARILPEMPSKDSMSKSETTPTCSRPFVVGDKEGKTTAGQSKATSPVPDQLCAAVYSASMDLPLAQYRPAQACQ